MSIIVTVPAATRRLTTLDRLRRELSLTDDTHDLVLDDMIARASDAIARECRRVFGRETVTETLAGSGSQLLELSRVPVVSITSITEDEVVLASTEYSVEDADAGAIWRRAGWGRGGLRMWGTEAYASGYILPGATDLRYAVTYTGGYLLPPQDGADLPGPVEQACLQTVKAWFTDAAGTGVSSVSSVQIGNLRVGYSTSGGTGSMDRGLPDNVLGLLRNYRRAT